MKSFDVSLYLVTDPHMSRSGVEDTVEKALKGGVTLVQLREKREIQENCTRKHCGSKQ